MSYRAVGLDFYHSIALVNIDQQGSFEAVIWVLSTNFVSKGMQYVYVYVCWYHKIFVLIDNIYSRYYICCALLCTCCIYVEILFDLKSAYPIFGWSEIMKTPVFLGPVVNVQEQHATYFGHLQSPELHTGLMEMLSVLCGAETSRNCTLAWAWYVLKKQLNISCDVGEKISGNTFPNVKVYSGFIAFWYIWHLNNFVSKNIDFSWAHWQLLNSNQLMTMYWDCDIFY